MKSQNIFEENGVYKTRTIDIPTQESATTSPSIIELKSRLEELRKDIVQDIAGLFIEDIDARKEEYREILNKVRIMQGKTPRSLK